MGAQTFILHAQKGTRELIQEMTRLNARIIWHDEIFVPEDILEEIVTQMGMPIRQYYIVSPDFSDSEIIDLKSSYQNGRLIDFWNCRTGCPNEAYASEVVFEEIAAQFGWLYYPASTTLSGSGIIDSNSNYRNGRLVDFAGYKMGQLDAHAYEAGRLYISRGLQGEYDPSTFKLYKALRAYIKKNYLYSKNSSAYWEKSFKAQNDANQLLAMREGRIVYF